MNCRVLFDFTNHFWDDTIVQLWACFAVVGTVVPALVIVFKRPKKVWRTALVCTMILVPIVCASGMIQSYREFLDLRQSYLQGKYHVVVGRIEYFRNEIPHQHIGQLNVKGRTFIWDPYGLVQRFSASASLTGAPILHDGMLVRLRYMDDRILRLEVAPCSR